MQIRDYTVPNCIVLADTVRLQQVFDNIIGNSYKYANTDILIHSAIENNFLAIDIVDSGKGVLADELLLLFKKYYRGKNSEDKAGYGLGLFISKYFSKRYIVVDRYGFIGPKTAEGNSGRLAESGKNWVSKHRPHRA